MKRRTHFGDPCIHCGVTHDDMQPGDCVGTGTPIPIGYVSLGVRWDGIEYFRVRFSDSHIEQRCAHISELVPYYHFGHSDRFKTPPRYDERLKRMAGGE